MRRLYLVHPLETWGTVEENRRDEAAVAADIAGRFPDVELVRPFVEIPEGASDRDAVMRRCLALLGECDGAILSGKWELSEGCRQEAGFCMENGLDLYIYKAAPSPGRKEDPE